jgi:hypothetical protein
MGKEPLYRVQRQAEEKAAWQDIVNIMRRVCRKPILKTAAQARQEHLKNNGY